MDPKQHEFYAPPAPAVYPQPPHVTEKHTLDASAVEAQPVEQLPEASERCGWAYFLLGFTLGFFVSFFAFIALCFHKPLEQSRRNRKYFIFGACLGILADIILLAIIVGVVVATSNPF